VIEALKGYGVDSEVYRLADLSIPPGVDSDLGWGDEWPMVRSSITSSEIVVFATPTWVGRPSSLAQRALERVDAMISETDEDGRRTAYNRVCGAVVTGNEDGAHHVISEVTGAWRHRVHHPAAGVDLLEPWSRTWSVVQRHRRGPRLAASTARATVSNLVAITRALDEHPIPAPPS
jgi:multimeric flavodoxin WrbA